MFQTDLKTLLLIISINKFLLGVLLVHLKGRVHSRTGIREWATGNFLTAFGLFLWAFYPYPASPIVDFLFSLFLNLCLLFGDILFLTGFWKFKKQPFKKYIFVFPLICSLIVIVFTLCFKSLALRMSLNHILFTVFYTFVASEIWKSPKNSLRYIFRLSAVLSAFYAFMQIVRTIYVILSPPLTPFHSSGFILFLFAVAGISMIMFSFNLVIIINSRLNEELVQEIAAKNKLYAIISHDLRGSFGNFLNYTSLVKQSIDSSNSELTKQYLVEMEKATLSSRFQLENLLFWSRSQLKEIQVNARQINIIDTILKSVFILEGQANPKSITIIFEKRNPVFVIADDDLLQIVIRNILSNAIKFTHVGGEITIALAEKDDELDVSISDNGIGMMKVQLEQLKNKKQTFFTTGTLNEKGTGFGLKLCNELLILHGGRLYIHDNQVSGTSVHVVLKSIKSIVNYEQT